MGSLANWGAIGGVGKGMQMNIDYDRTKETSDFEEARERRLVDLKAQIDQESQTREFEQQGKIADKNITGQKDIAQMDITGRSDLQIGDQEFKQKIEMPFTAEENAADRASAERRTQTSADASGGGASKRFTAKTVKNTRPSASNPRMSEEYDQIAIVDNASGRTFVQTGDVFVPQGGTPPEQRMRASRKAVDALMQRPELADQFLNEYHYLPIEVYQALQSQGGNFSSRRTTDSARGVNAMDVVGADEE